MGGALPVSVLHPGQRLKDVRVESRLSPASAFGLVCYLHTLCLFCMLAVALLSPVGKRS
jgi:hypothetical protein